MRSPGYLLLAALILALAIGANTAVFTAAQALILRPLPYPGADRLIAIHEVLRDGAEADTSLAALDDYRNSRALAGAAAGRGRTFGLQTTGGAPAEVVMAGMVTHDWFGVLGTAPQLGRAWTAAEEVSGHPGLVLSHGAWQRRFGGDPGVLGRTVLLNGQPYAVLGVLPASFSYQWGDRAADLWIPISHADYGGRRETRAVTAIARLAVPAAEAQAALDLLAGQWGQSYESHRGGGLRLRSLRAELQGRYEQPVRMLAFGALLITCIAAANLTHLLLVRFGARRRELAIRLSLGARWLDLAGLFFRESAIVAAAGGVGGFALSLGLLRLIPYPVEQGWTPALFAGAAAVVSTLALPLLPLVQIRRLALEQEMREGGPATAGSRRTHRLRAWIVTAEVGLSVVLLAGCLLLARSLYEVLQVDPGFATAQVYRFGLGIPEARYDSEAKMAAFYPRLEAELRGIPGVSEVGIAARLPLSGEPRRWRFRFPGEEQQTAAMNLATPGFFRTLAIPLVAGRAWGEADPGRTALVNQAFVERFGRGVGARIEFAWNGPAAVEVIGVVGNVRQKGLDAAPAPEVYLPLAYFPSDGMQVLARGARADAAIPAAMAAALRRVDGELERVNPQPMEQWVERSVGDRRLAVAIGGGLAAVALLLAGIGLYGVMAAIAQQKRREIALRAALGATRGDIVRLLVGLGCRLAGPGLAAGVAGYFALEGLLRERIFGVAPWDPLLLVGVTAGTALVAVAASLGPALRARHADPARVLR